MSAILPQIQAVATAAITFLETITASGLNPLNRYKCRHVTLQLFSLILSKCHVFLHLKKYAVAEFVGGVELQSYCALWNENCMYAWNVDR